MSSHTEGLVEHFGGYL